MNINVVVVADDVDPEIECPESIAHLVSDDTHQVLTFPGDLEATATDNEASPTITYEPPSLTIDSSNIGESFIVTATATDQSGNTQSCRFMVYLKGEYDLHSFFKKVR